MKDQFDQLAIPIRPRRNRKSSGIRNLVRETHLQASQLIYPMFMQSGGEDTSLDSMPGQIRYAVSIKDNIVADGMLKKIESCLSSGLTSVVLFPKVEDQLKTRDGRAATHDDGLVPHVVRFLKETFPELMVMTDVALDPYSSDGHDGIVSDEGEILNDETIEVLCQQALTHARAGADMVSPSDMMDGRVEAIRTTLDDHGYTRTSIMSYTAKYASAFYGPFRGALDSAPKADSDRKIPSGKETYQMDPANRREARKEAMLDESEGADMLMVKPAGAYLDIISDLKQASDLPIAAYQVSGEYLMIKSAAQAGWLDEKAAVLESLLSIKRAGADIILSYFAPEVAEWLN